MSLEEVHLDIGGSPAQLAFWQSKARFRAFIGGVGSGKTFAGAVEIMRQPPGSIGVVVAPTFPMLRDSTLKTFLQVAAPMIYADGFKRSEMTMRLHNGTEILWRSADNPDSLRGPNLGWWWLDEGALVGEDVLDILMGRLRLEPGRGWVTTTPKGFNWLHKVFVKEKRPDYALVRCSTKSNPFLPPEFIASLEGKYVGAWAAQELRGEFADWVTSPVYVGFARDLNLEDGAVERYRPTLPLILCCDFNVRFMSWPVVQVIKGEPFVLREITSAPDAPATIEDMVRRFRNVYPAHPAEVWVYGDASGRGRTAQTGQSDYDLMELAFRGYPSRVVFNVPEANPPVKDRINAVNRLLRGAGGAPTLRIDGDHAPEFVADLLQTEWNKQGTAELQVLDPADEKSKRSHSAAGFGCWAHREYPVSKELYPEAKAIRPIEVGKLLGLA